MQEVGLVIKMKCQRLGRKTVHEEAKSNLISFGKKTVMNAQALMSHNRSALLKSQHGGQLPSTSKPFKKQGSIMAP